MAREKMVPRQFRHAIKKSALEGVQKTTRVKDSAAKGTSERVTRARIEKTDKDKEELSSGCSAKDKKSSCDDDISEVIAQCMDGLDPIKSVLFKVDLFKALASVTAKYKADIPDSLKIMMD